MKKILYTCGFIATFMNYAGDTVNYGKVYIKNSSPWDISVTAEVKDEWDNITETEWRITKEDAEVLGNIITLKNISFKVDTRNELNIPSWLQDKTFAINLPLEQNKDLVVYLSKSRFGNRWDIQHRFYNAVKLEYGKSAGRQLSIEMR